MFGVEIGTAVGEVVRFAVSEGEAVGVAVTGEEVETASELLSGVFVETASEVLSGDFVETVSEVLLGACVEAVPVVPGEVVVTAVGACVTALSGETVGLEVLELLHLFK